MAKLIDVDTVEERLRDLAASSVNQTVSLLKGGVFALAAVVLIEIAFAPDDRLVRLILWASSLFAAMTSYNAWINSTVTLFREGVANVIAMIVQGMIELMAFAALTPRPMAQAWRYWIVATVAFFIVTALRLAIPMNQGVRIAPALDPLFRMVAANRRATARLLLANVVIGALLAAAVVRLPLASPWPRWLCIAYGTFNIVQASFAMFQQQKERGAMEALIEQSSAAG
jgi:hypothetical protein